MGWNFRRSVKLLPGVRLNFSHRGIGVSVGVPGARLSLSPGGRVTRTLGIPGTGIYHRQTLGRGRRTGTPQPSGTQATGGTTIVATPPASPSPLPLDRAVHALNAGDLASAEEFAAAAMIQSGSVATSGAVEVQVTPGVVAALPPGRDAAALLLGEIRQARGDISGALEAVAEASPTTHAAVAACELLLQASRFEDVVELTETLEAIDDAACVALIFRGVAFRELGQLDQSGEALGATVAATSSEAIQAHAHFERALTFRAAGLEERAREELELIPQSHRLGPAAQAQLAGATELRLSDVLPDLDEVAEAAEDPLDDDLPPLELPDL